MTGTAHFTVDVEDFYDGMAVLGHPLERRGPAGAGLLPLLESLQDLATRPRLTLFVVGAYAESLRPELQAFAEAGHEVASHGPDHGRLPERDLTAWLRRGREVLEQVLQLPVRGFRSPRFDIPGCGLARYREHLAEAGYHYVSDADRLGDASPVRELPVLRQWGVLVGGGSYQRLLPAPVVGAAVRRSDAPAVLYYHSYDFDASLPPLSAVRSPAVAKQVVLRGRIASTFHRMVARFGSERCIDAAG